MSVRTDTVTEAEAGARLDRWLRRRFPDLTQGRIEKLLRTGQIRVDGARAKSATRLEAGQSVRIPPLPDSKAGEAAAPSPFSATRPPVAEKDAAFIRSLVLYEDDALIALNKPSGLAVQGGSKQSRHLDGMLPALVRRGGETPRLVHRLDRDTSGVIVVAKSADAAAGLAAAFRSRAAKKTYWAVVLGVPRPPQGEISGWLRKSAGGAHGREQMDLARHGEEDARHARTLYSVIDTAGQRAAWIALRPITGRTHQLRVQMAAFGHAIAGDRKYTCDRPTPETLPPRLHLHARELVLPRPGGALTLTAPLPPHLCEAFETLGFDEARAPADPFAGLE